MIYLIQLFGILMIVGGIAIFIDPLIVFGPMRRNKDSLGLHILAVVVRVILGALLLAYAAQSNYPKVITILGWISLGAAAVLVLIGRRRFMRLMSWALGLAQSFGRVSGLFVLLFGAFLVYAFV